jgi:haloalkane dehalogenase
VDSHVNLLVSTRRISASISGQLAIMSSLMAFRGSSWRPAMFRELKSRNPDLRIIANDSGGAVAQLFVTRYQERVRTLLLTNCDVERDSPPAAVLPVIEHARAGTFADLWLAPWVADKALARSPKGLGGIAYTYPSQLSDDTIDYYLGPLVSSPQRKALVNAYAIALDPNPLAGIEPALRRCTVPTRIVWETGDDILSQTSPDYLDRTFANSRGVRRVPGAKLFFPEEMPELIAEEAMQL